MTQELADSIIGPVADKLMPSSGSCETLEGELIRAICKIRYRFYNDGDYWFEGYGCETAGSAHAFLVARLPQIEELKEVRDLLVYSYGEGPERYGKSIDLAGTRLAEWVQMQMDADKLTTTKEDMFDYESQYDEQYEEDEGDGYY